MPFISSTTGSFYAGRRSVAGAWSPETDITTSTWIDASNTGKYTASGTNLSTVTDVRDNSNYDVNGIVQTNSTTLNGLNVFDFNGTQSISSTGPTAQVSLGNHWAIGVFRWDTVDSNKDSIWSFETNGSPKRDYAVSSGNASNSWPGELDLDNLSSDRVSTTIGDKQEWDLESLTRYQWHIVAVFFNKTGNQIGVRVDGSNAFTPVNDYDNSLQTYQKLQIMRNRASQKLEGKFAEFFVVADIPGTGGTDMSTLEKAEGYLAHKWDLTSSLPGSHAYKTTAPTGS